MKDLNEKIKEFKKRGWDYSKEGVNRNIICPSGLVYSFEHLDYPCAICQCFLESNPNLDETICDHLEEDIIEMREAESFLRLIREFEKIDFSNCFKQ